VIDFYKTLFVIYDKSFHQR